MSFGICLRQGRVMPEMRVLKKNSPVKPSIKPHLKSIFSKSKKKTPNELDVAH